MECIACLRHQVTEDYPCQNNHQSLCLECLSEWTKRTPTCPICRTKYESIPTSNDVWGGLLNILREPARREVLMEKLIRQVIVMADTIQEIISENPFGAPFGIEGDNFSLHIHRQERNRGRISDDLSMESDDLSMESDDLSMESDDDREIYQD